MYGIKPNTNLRSTKTHNLQNIHKTIGSREWEIEFARIRGRAWSPQREETQVLLHLQHVTSIKSERNINRSR